MINSRRLLLRNNMVSKTFHSIYRHSHYPMAITNTSTPRWVHGISHRATTNSSPNPRGCRFLRLPVDPSGRSDVLGMRKGRHLVERSSVCPVCTRRSGWHYPSSKYVFFCMIVTLSLNNAYSRDDIRLHSRRCAALDSQGCTSVFRTPCSPRCNFFVLFNDYDSRSYSCSYGAEKAWGIGSDHG